MILKSIERDPTAQGFLGSDRLKEDGYTGFSESVEPVMNAKGQPLRFALIATNSLKTRTKLINNEPLVIATSYPATTTRIMGPANEIEYVAGGLEAELIDRPEIDCAFELVQSGDSVRQNGLQIIEDDIESVTLESLYTPFDW